MEIVTRYKCDLCNSEYLDEASAVECERQHITDLKLVGTEYEDMFVRGLRFPVRVLLQSPNGEKMIYRVECK